jgi:DNA modification methylase
VTSQRIIQGDCVESLRTLPDASVHCCVTSPPYWGLRDYGHDGQIGLESTPKAYVARMVEVFREVRRVLRDDGTCWVNLGDSYCGGGGYAPDAPCNVARQSGDKAAWGKLAPMSSAQASSRKGLARVPDGLKAKDLVGIPWRVAFALQADGWWLRQDIIWHKPNPMPESVRDRCTKAHEYVFLLTKSERYYYDAEAVSEASVAGHLPGNKKPHKGLESDADRHRTRAGLLAHHEAVREAGGYTTRNRRSVWTVTTKPYSGAHFAVMPAALVEPCIKAGCPEQCCQACGKGWERVVEKGKPVSASSENRFATNKKRDEAYCRNDGGTLGNMNGKIWAEHKAANPDKLLGWQPACDCAASGTIPGTVIDPFAGSGTTLAVAAELGRSGIGCELNPEYIALAERRIKDARSSVALFEGIPA